MNAAESAYLVTCDGYYRRGEALNQKNKADNARIAVDGTVETIVVDRLGDELPHFLGDDQYDWDELVATQEGVEVDPVPRNATDPLFLIYTSGTTGEPKGVEHTTGGYLAHVAWTAHAVLDLKPEDTYWCSADIGWITGHSYVVYGPLALGTTSMMYEGTPDYPDRNRLWTLIERNQVDVFYTAPTAIRAFMKWGEEYPENHDLSSLRLLGTVGEPINPRAWKWYYEHIGNEECPIVDTWWQTETGGMMISTLPGVDTMKPGAAGKALPGVSVDVVDEAGDSVPPGQSGYLVVDRPWPGLPRNLDVATDEDEWRYFPGDGALVDEDGYVTVLGRIDDVINVSSRRFSTMELESAIVDVAGVAEAAVVGADHDIKGESIYAYVITEDGTDADEALRDRIVESVERAIGPMARPDLVVFTPELPKTRSGKIMRRLLEDVANGADLGDMSALRNPEIVGELREAFADDE
jgi:acetyl-CoA synthetase